jgi:hypothetical protein
MREIWTKDKIKEGFEKFFKENGRLPTALEIDKLDYLPSSRQIQRSFGGLEKLRADLGYENTHFGKGFHRSQIATKSNIRGRDSEIKLERVLKDKFGEVFVHTEKIFDDSKNRADFYIYSPDFNFGIDIFYTENIHGLQGNINIKINKYKNFKDKLYFVVGNNLFKQSELDKYNSLKREDINIDFRIVNLDELYKLIQSMNIYPNPLKNEATNNYQ